MPYFTPEFIEFFRQLERHNTREWFHAHKRDYEAHVKEPFLRFVAEMIHRVGAVDRRVAIEPKDALFRIARDIRFSKDKTPYKTYMAAAVNPGGRRNIQYPGLFFRFGAAGTGIAGGVHQPDKVTLHRIRVAIVNDGAALTRALRGKAFISLFGDMRGDRNKRLPREFAAAAERFPLIANKQFYYYADYPDPKLLLRDDLPGFLMQHYRAGQKVNHFLAAAIDADGRSAGVTPLSPPRGQKTRPRGRAR